MSEVGWVLEKHVREVWMARGAIVVTAVLNAFLINDLTIFPWGWLQWWSWRCRSRCQWPRPGTIAQCVARRASIIGR